MDSAINSSSSQLGQQKRVLFLWLFGVTLAALATIFLTRNTGINEVTSEGKITNIAKNFREKYRSSSTIYLTTPDGFRHFYYTSDDKINFLEFNKSIDSLKIGDHISVNSYDSRHGDLVAYEIDRKGENVFKIDKEQARLLATSFGKDRTSFWLRATLCLYGACIYLISIQYIDITKKTRKSWTGNEFYISRFLLLPWIISIAALVIYLIWIIVTLPNKNGVDAAYTIFGLSLFFLLCFLFPLLRTFFLAGKPIISLSESSIKYKKNEIPYADIKRMSAYNTRYGSYIVIEKNDSTSVNISTTLVNALPRDIFESIIKYRKDLAPIAGWDWTNVQ